MSSRQMLVVYLALAVILIPLQDAMAQRQQRRAGSNPCHQAYRDARRSCGPDGQADPATNPRLNAGAAQVLRNCTTMGGSQSQDGPLFGSAMTPGIAQSGANNQGNLGRSLCSSTGTAGTCAADAELCVDVCETQGRAVQQAGSAGATRRRGSASASSRILQQCQNWSGRSPRSAGSDRNQASNDSPQPQPSGSPKPGQQGAGAAAMQAMSQLAQMYMQMKQMEMMAAMAAQTPMPAMDCSNPLYAKDSVLCICQRDPKNRMCTEAEPFGSGIVTTNAPVGPASPTGPGLNDPISGDGVSMNNIAAGQPKTASGSASIDGGGGGAGLGGARGGPPIQPNSDDGRPGPSGINTAIITGQAGSGGGGGGTGSPGGYPMAAGGRGSGGFNGGSNNGFNLKPLLPTWKARSIAGMSVPAKDGMTAPLGPSLFEKVSRQYQIQKRQMIQDR